jgi:hypothetical protein
MKIGAHHGRGLSETLRLPKMFPEAIRGFLEALANFDHPVSGSTLITESRSPLSNCQKSNTGLKGTGFGIC